MTGSPPDDFDLIAYRAQWPEDSFLAQLAQPVLTDWLRTGRIQRFASREVLINEGARDSSVFLLLSGCVKVGTRLPSGKDALLAIRRGGDLVGELAALAVGRRAAIVWACGRDPVVACELTSEQFTSVLATHPEVTLTLARSITGKFRSATRRRIDYTTSSPEVCIARALLELVVSYGHPVGDSAYVITIDLTYRELGTLIGVGESTALRALQEMRQREVVNMSGRRPLINDLAALREIAELPDSETGK